MTTIRPYENIDPIPDNDPDAVPELWNAGRRQMDGNFSALDTSLQAALGSISSQAAQITNLENDSATSVTQALRLDWLYSSKAQVALELFYDSWTLLPGLETVVTDAVGGDDSIDVDSVTGLEVGGTYVVFDDDNQESFVIAEILTGTRIRATGDLTYSYSDAKIRKTSWTNNGGSATATAGGIYYSGVLNLGDEYQDKALIIRRQDNDGSLAVYFKDDNHEVWTEVPWAWIRDIETGIIDVEYIIPARGVFEFKVVSVLGDSDEEFTIKHMTAVNAATGLRGVHNPPATPDIVSPVNGATDIDEQPSLTTSGFVSPTGDQLAGTRIQISTNSDFSEEHLIIDAIADAGVSWAPGKSLLAVSTVYFARALHMDVAGGVSDWSSAISFTTASTFISVNKPTCTTPAASTELGTPDGLTLVSSVFATSGGENTHANSQWQVGSDSALATILHDSGTDDTNLVSYNVPDSTVERGSTYYWRVRHEGTTGGWSDWSLSTVFSVSVMPPVEDVFSTTLYTGTGAALDIVNDIDLAGEDGMVWLKDRDAANYHCLFDTIRGAEERLSSSLTNAESSMPTALTAFNVAGFTIGTSGVINSSLQDYVSWAFRKAPRFFDIVTYTGNGVAGRQISHNLGCAPGMIVVKRLDLAIDWKVYHRSIGATKWLEIDTTSIPQTSINLWNNTEPTDSVFTVGMDGGTNYGSATYVAYLFAHDASDAGLIQCGTYTGNGSTTGTVINLGWEPQYLLIKRTDNSDSWNIFDSQRVSGSLDPCLAANSSDSENNNLNIIDWQSSGFQLTHTDANWNTSGGTYIYMAIRKPEA